jgi:hypothetical protein
MARFRTTAFRKATNSATAPKLREAAGVKGSQRFGDDVFRVGGGQPERSKRAAAKW